MCTLALYFKVFEDYPLVVAANRDEHYDRPSAPPASLGGKTAILAGRDLRAGGTWLGVNEHGLLAGILNRRADGEQESPIDPRSRGLLCLDLVEFKSAGEARGFIRAQEESYRPFTLVCADTDDAWSADNAGGRIELEKLAAGLHVFSSTGESDRRSRKSERAYGQFARMAVELQASRALAADRFLSMQTVLADHTLGAGSGAPTDAICMHGELSGTVSSSIVLYSRRERRFQTFFCAGAPCRNHFGKAIELEVR